VIQFNRISPVVANHKISVLLGFMVKLLPSCFILWRLQETGCHESLFLSFLSPSSQMPEQCFVLGHIINHKLVKTAVGSKVLRVAFMRLWSVTLDIRNYWPSMFLIFFSVLNTDEQYSRNVRSV
jgi:hypothetical protein